MPKVETPLSAAIGVSTIVGTTTVGGALMLLLAIALRLPHVERTAMGQFGIAGGFVFGLFIYLAALAVQLLCRQ